MAMNQGLLLTGGTVVHQCSKRLAIPPVPVKVSDGQLGDFVLDPAQETLLGSQLSGVILVLILPHGHGDGVV